jgi:Domain of unknown function (DUF4893)
MDRAVNVNTLLTIEVYSLNPDADDRYRLIMRNPMITFSLFCSALGLAGCGGDRPEPVKEPVTANWKSIITGTDQNRLRDWRDAFVKALDKAKASGNGSSIAREGALLDPDSGLANPAIADGSYKCRAIKIGGKGKLMGDYVVFPATPCTITAEGQVHGFAKSGGTQRPVGLIFPAEGTKMIFLGTMVLGDESRALEYGRDRDRDMVGAVERIGDQRWRLILPQPRFDGMMDVIEIIPA